MGDTGAGIVTTQVDGWTVTSNSAKDEGTLRASLKPKVEAALSNAGKELGKKGAEAKAKAAEEKPEPAEAQKAVDEQERRAEAKMAKDVAPEPEKQEAKPAETDEKGAEKSAPEPEAKPEGKKPERTIDRMLEATRKAAEAKRQLQAEKQAREALEARLAALERGERPAPKEEAKPARDLSKKPAPDAFESYEEYLDARDDYNRAQWEAEIQHRQTLSAVDRALSEQVGKFHKAAAQNLDQYSEDVLSLKTEFQLSEGEQPTGENWIANELVFSPETAPALMLHFTAHPDDLRRISELSTPRAVSREMAKLEARLESATPGKPATSRDDDVSRAAPPVKPVTGKPYVTEEGYRPGMSLDEYVKWRKKQKA